MARPSPNKPIQTEGATFASLLLQVYEQTSKEQMKTAGLAISKQEDSMPNVNVHDKEPNGKSACMTLPRSK